MAGGEGWLLRLEGLLGKWEEGMLMVSLLSVWFVRGDGRDPLELNGRRSMNDYEGKTQDSQKTWLTNPPAYRTAHTTRLPAPYVASPRHIYHALHPHPALSPVPDPTDPASVDLQSANDAAYRELLSRRLLHTLLPPAERDNPALMALVGSILADLVVEKAVERASEPGVIWEGIAKVVESVSARGKSARRLDRGDDGTTKGGWQATFWMLLQVAFLAFAAVRALIIAVATSSSLPRRGVRLSKSTTTATTEPTPVLGMKMWSFLAKQVELEDRMPWAYGALALGQWLMLYGPGRVGAVDGVVDRYVCFYFIRSLFFFVLFSSRHDPAFRSVLLYSRYDPSFGPCILPFPSLPLPTPRPLWNSYPTQPNPTIFSSQSLHSKHPYHPLKNTLTNLPLFFNPILDPRRHSAYTFNHLTCTPVRFLPVIAAPLPFPTPLASQVDESGHICKPSATNASLATLCAVNSGATALPCIGP